MADEPESPSAPPPEEAPPPPTEEAAPPAQEDVAPKEESAAGGAGEAPPAAEPEKPPPSPEVKEKEAGAGAEPASTAAAAEPPKEELPAPGPPAGDKKKRRQSMFTEADDLQSLMDSQNQGADLTTTLQGFFAYQSLSQEAVVQKPLRRPKLIFQNTFRLESMKPFAPSRIEGMMSITMNEILENVRYNSKTVNTTCAQVAEKIRARLLTYRFDRYKLIVMVTIGSMTRQGVHIGFRNLWDPNRDNYATATFKNLSIFAVACVYAVYYE